MAVMYSQNGVIIRNAGINVIGGKKYKTARMPDGKIWLAENLDFKFCNVGGSGNPTTANAWYYNNNETTYGWNGYKCGLLYNWYAVKLLNDNKSELCPGWHVPSDSEWGALATACGGTSIAGQKLKALDSSAGAGFPISWNGADDYTFSVLPSGGYRTGSFVQIGDHATFWTATEYDTSYAYNLYFDTSSSFNSGYYGSKASAYSLRLVRDSN